MTKTDLIIELTRRQKVATAVPKRSPGAAPKSPNHSLTMNAPTVSGAFEAGKPPSQENLSRTQLNPGGINLDGGTQWPKVKATIPSVPGIK